MYRLSQTQNEAKESQLLPVRKDASSNEGKEGKKARFPNSRPVHSPERTHSTHIVPVIGVLVPSEAVESGIWKDVGRRRKSMEEGAVGS